MNTLAVAFVLLITGASTASAQIISPPEPDPPRVLDTNFPQNQQPSAVILGTTHTYKVCWTKNPPYIWDWKPNGSVTLTEVNDGDPMCISARIRYNAIGAGGTGITYRSSNYYWNPSNLYVSIRHPVLTDTVGPFRICGRITKNGTNVGPNVTRCRSGIAKSSISGNNGGISASAPANVNAVCGEIVDMPTGWTPAHRHHPDQKMHIQLDVTKPPTPPMRRA